MNKKHLGSDFDDFLKKEGILIDAEMAAMKRVIAFQIAELMNENKLSKTELAKRMRTSRSSVDRLLDPKNEAVTLQTLGKAASALGKKLHVSFVN